MSIYETAKFWNRLGAFIIDTIILGVFGFILGLVFNDYFVSIGQYGLLVGLGICLVYFTISNSKILGGKTLGKRITNIKVVNQYDSLLTVKESFIRSLIFTIPYFLLGFSIPGVSDFSFIQTIKSIVFFSIDLGIVYFFIFNTPTRQTIHDYFVKSYVVSSYEEFEPIERKKLKPLIVYIFGGLIVLCVALQIVFISSNTMSGLADLEKIQTKLCNIDGVLNSIVTSNVSTFTSENKSSTTKNFICYLSVEQKFDNESTLEKDERILKAAEIILTQYPNIKTYDNIIIGLNRSYNIGIASSNNSINASKSPNDWIEIIKK